MSPWTPRQVRFLESSGSPLTAAQKDKMNAELHANPLLGHNQKGSAAMKKSPAGHMREMRIEIHRGPKKEVTGYTVHHHMLPSAASKSGAFMEHETHTQPFSAKEHGAMVDHVQEHLDGVKGGGATAAEEAAEGE
jgi:hypothetical protein